MRQTDSQVLCWNVAILHCWTFSVPVWGHVLNSRSPELLCSKVFCIHVIRYSELSMLQYSTILCTKLMLSPCWFLSWTVAAAAPTLSRMLKLLRSSLLQCCCLSTTSCAKLLLTSCRVWCWIALRSLSYKPCAKLFYSQFLVVCGTDDTAFEWSFAKPHLSLSVCVFKLTSNARHM